MLSLQCLQLLEYFESLGAVLAKNQNGECLDVGQFIKFCHLCLKEAKETDAECVLNSVVVLLIQLPTTESLCSQYINAFCDKLVESANSQNAPLCIRVYVLCNNLLILCLIDEYMSSLLD